MVRAIISTAARAQDYFSTGAAFVAAFFAVGLGAAFFAFAGAFLGAAGADFTAAGFAAGLAGAFLAVVTFFAAGAGFVSVAGADAGALAGALPSATISSMPARKSATSASGSGTALVSMFTPT